MWTQNHDKYSGLHTKCMNEENEENFLKKSIWGIVLHIRVSITEQTTCQHIHHITAYSKVCAEFESLDESIFLRLMLLCEKKGKSHLTLCFVNK